MNYVHDSETTWPVHVTVTCCNYAYQQHEILATGHLSQVYSSAYKELCLNIKSHYFLCFALTFILKPLQRLVKWPLSDGISAILLTAKPGNHKRAGS